MVNERRAEQDGLAEREARFRSLAEGAPGLVAVLDGQGRLLYANPIAATLLGWTTDELVGRDLDDLAASGGAETRQALQRLAAGGPPCELCLRHRDGTARTFEAVAAPLAEPWEQPAILLHAWDVTVRREQEQARAVEAQRLVWALRGSGDGVWEWDLQTGRVRFSAEASALLWGETAETDGRPQDWMERIHPDDRPGLEAELAAHLERGTPRLQYEHRLQAQGGTERWILARGRAVRDEEGRARLVVGTLSDITDRKAAEQLLAHQIAHDPLTGLPNRAAFLDRLERTLARARRGPDHRFAVLFLDLDRFKLVNDSLGHLSGDQVLVAVSRRLVAALRPSDLVAHLNGDEFAILVDQMRAHLDASHVAERIHHALRAPFRVADQDCFLSASIGIAFSEGGYDQPADMLRDADAAMYRSKSRSAGRTELFDPRMNALARARLKLETDLRLALERDELRIHYQPIVSLVSGEISGFEALVRWMHPERGLLGPAEFVPVAEETGLIVPMCSWVLRECCRQGSAWQRRMDSGDISVSMNLAAPNLAQAEMAQEIETELRESGLSGRQLALEITESVLMSDLQAVASVLMDLKRLDVELHIDDFGTGYSSLSYLHSLPADALKIDRSFVSAMEGPGGDAVIVRTIVELAHNLGRSVIAEGVETPGQLARLRAMGCEYAQGYYFARPLEPARAEELLRSRPRW